MKAETLEAIKSWRFHIILLVACYGLTVAGPLSYLILPLIFWGMFAFGRREAWGKFAVLLLANPLAIGVLLGIKDYAGGAPRMLSHGLPDVESWNIQPNTRCFYGGGGCVVQGNEWVIDAPHNWTLYLLSSILGAPAKSYDGPYPDRVTASRLVAAAPQLDFKAFMEGRFRVGNQEFVMPRENVSPLTESLGLYGLGILEEDEFPQLTRVQAVLFEGRCLILKMVQTDPLASSDSSPDLKGIALVDAKNMRPFCYYLSRDSRHSAHFPKLHYLIEDSR